MVICYLNDSPKLLDSTLYSLIQCRFVNQYYTCCLTALGLHSVVEIYVCRWFVSPIFGAKCHRYTLVI